MILKYISGDVNHSNGGYQNKINLDVVIITGCPLKITNSKIRRKEWKK